MKKKYILVNQLKVFTSEINIDQEQLHTQNYREHIWKTYEFQIGL